MKIAILHFKFDSRLEYFENILADTLFDMGHHIKVFTTKFGCEDLQENELAIQDKNLCYDVIRCKSHVSFRTNVIPLSNDIPCEIKKFNPDIAFVFAPHHGAVAFWINSLSSTCKIISGFSDLLSHRINWFSWNFIKKPIIENVLRRSCICAAMTNDTLSLFRRNFSEDLLKKVIMTGLPFKHHNKLKITQNDGIFHKTLNSNTKYIAIATMFRVEKRIELILNECCNFMLHNSDYKLIVAGFSKDQYSSKLYKMIEKSPLYSRIQCYPLLSMNDFYSLMQKSHFSIWPSVSIGVLKSLHCGCPVIIADSYRSSIDHYSVNGINSLFFSYDIGSLSQSLVEASNTDWDRKVISASVEKFTAESVINKLLSYAS